MEQYRGTTILSYRRNGQVVIGGDGQVSLGNTVMKGNARKVRRLYTLIRSLRDSPAVRPMRLLYLNVLKPSLKSIKAT